MSIWELMLLLMSGWRWRSLAREYHATPAFLKHVKEMPEAVAAVSGAGAERGPRFYDYHSSGSESDSEIKKHSESSSASLDTDSAKESKRSTDASSFETEERRIATRTYRECTPCPLDMIRKHTNMGIKWICGAYQRARRSFKSDCMMRFRNCQDGTLFIKIGDHRCKEDAYHGRHWFYIYKV